MVNWAGKYEDSDDMYDTISSKNIVMPEANDVLHLEVGTVCQATFQGQHYDVKVIARGKTRNNSLL